jgi:hypothetical protein
MTEEFSLALNGLDDGNRIIGVPNTRTPYRQRPPSARLPQQRIPGRTAGMGLAQEIETPASSADRESRTVL